MIPSSPFWLKSLRAQSRMVIGGGRSYYYSMWPPMPVVEVGNRTLV
jgi:hypothetical protein